MACGLTRHPAPELRSKRVPGLYAAIHDDPNGALQSEVIRRVGSWPLKMNPLVDCFSISSYTRARTIMLNRYGILNGVRVLRFVGRGFPATGPSPDMMHVRKKASDDLWFLVIVG